MEEMMMMINISPENHRRSETNIPSEPITTSTCPSWKLYENPFYYPHHHQHQHQQHRNNKHLPRSTRKIAASFWDLTFFRPFMESELEFARAQIMELKAELEYERKARKKVESMNKRQAKELAEERRGREAVERVCEELAKEISFDKAEINRMKREMEEERKMLRMAEVLREERVQMKLTDAKILLEEKLLELEESRRMQTENSSSKLKEKNQQDNPPLPARLVLSENSTCNDSNDFDSRELTRLDLDEKACNNSFMTIQRKASPEPENPHIKRGIKGFVEFPRVVRAIGSKSRHWGTKLECQKAQLRILLKQRSPIRSNNLIFS